ncbi:MAG: lactoylglutathione lyase [Bradymonadia bacterium]
MIDDDRGDLGITTPGSRPRSRAISVIAIAIPGENMQLGAFSISLAVKDIAASRAFYGHLGFESVGGDADQGWLILRNDTITIGLFQGMFEKNALTFNPGWDPACNALPEFTDVRALQAKLEAAEFEFTVKVDPTTQSGPGSFVVVDPDANPVLVDQHV